MTTEAKWEGPAAAVSYLGTELNALANNARVLGGAIANEAGKEMYIALELYLAAQAAARDAGASVDIYLLPSLTSGNFCYGDASVEPPADTLFHSFPLDASTNARYVTVTTLLIPPFDFKLLPKNRTGQAFAGTGNTLKYRLHSLESQ
jgi:hypothetical protein